MSDCCWGVVDGFNESGLAVSLTFGGRSVVGNGFGVTIVLRYVLEFCDNVSEAISVLKRVPVHMTYNVTVLDKSGQFRTVFMSPDRDPVVRQSAATTNHQESVEWHQHAHPVSRPKSMIASGALRVETQRNGRIRHWALITEVGKYLRVVTEPDGKTVHNAFFDRGFRS